MGLVYGSIRMEGFPESNHTADIPQAMPCLADWTKQGQLL